MAMVVPVLPDELAEICRMESMGFRVAPAVINTSTSNDIQQIVQKAIQEKDQQEKLAQKMSNDANAKLVQDLKTISAVIEQKKQDKDSGALSTPQLQ